MTLPDVDLLDLLAVQANIKPCHVSRADLLRLLPLVGFEPGDLVWQDVVNGSDLMLVMPDAVLMMIEMARSGRRMG
jgi:hypothetical protein